MRPTEIVSKRVACKVAVLPIPDSINANWKYLETLPCLVLPGIPDGVAFAISSKAVSAGHFLSFRVQTKNCGLRLET